MPYSPLPYSTVPYNTLQYLTVPHLLFYSTLLQYITIPELQNTFSLYYAVLYLTLPHTSEIRNMATSKSQFDWVLKQNTLRVQHIIVHEVNR